MHYRNSQPPIQKPGARQVEKLALCVTRGSGRCDALPTASITLCRGNSISVYAARAWQARPDQLTLPCRYQDPLAELSGSDSDSAESDSEKELSFETARAQKKRKQTDKIDLQTLQQHGYKSGPSVLYVPAPQQAEQTWEWYGK